MEMPDDVQAELLRLHHAEARSWMIGEISVAIHCRLLWCELYLTAGGPPAPGTPVLVERAGAIQENLESPAAMWRKRLRARPLVAVVRRKREVWFDGSGGRHALWIETLACGHSHTAWYPEENGKFARRRRCAECGDIRAAARTIPQESQPNIHLVTNERAKTTTGIRAVGS